MFLSRFGPLESQWAYRSTKRVRYPHHVHPVPGTLIYRDRSVRHPISQQNACKEGGQMWGDWKVCRKTVNTLPSPLPLWQGLEAQMLWTLLSTSRFRLSSTPHVCNTKAIFGRYDEFRKHYQKRLWKFWMLDVLRKKHKTNIWNSEVRIKITNNFWEGISS